MGCEEALVLCQLLLFCSTMYILIDIFIHGKQVYKNAQMKKFWEEYKPDPITLTCYNCCQRDMCAFVDDAYNTNGDCLADK